MLLWSQTSLSGRGSVRRYGRGGGVCCLFFQTKVVTVESEVSQLRVRCWQVPKSVTVFVEVVCSYGDLRNHPQCFPLFTNSETNAFLVSSQRLLCLYLSDSIVNVFVTVLLVWSSINTTETHVHGIQLFQTIAKCTCHLSKGTPSLIEYKIKANLAKQPTEP